MKIKNVLENLAIGAFYGVGIIVCVVAGNKISDVLKDK